MEVSIPQPLTCPRCGSTQLIPAIDPDDYYCLGHFGSVFLLVPFDMSTIYRNEPVLPILRHAKTSAPTT